MRPKGATSPFLISQRRVRFCWAICDVKMFILIYYNSLTILNIDMILNKGQNVKNLILPIFEIDNRLNINRVTSERQKRIALQLALARKFGTKYLEKFCYVFTHNFFLLNNMWIHIEKKLCKIIIHFKLYYLGASRFT